MSRELVDIDLAAAMELIDSAGGEVNPNAALGLIRRAKHRLTAAEYGLLVEADAPAVTHPQLVSERSDG